MPGETGEFVVERCDRRAIGVHPWSFVTGRENVCLSQTSPFTQAIADSKSRRAQLAGPS
jgi:hypothetical protein